MRVLATAATATSAIASTASAAAALAMTATAATCAAAIAPIVSVAAAATAAAAVSSVVLTGTPASPTIMRSVCTVVSRQWVACWVASAVLGEFQLGDGQATNLGITWATATRQQNEDKKGLLLMLSIKYKGSCYKGRAASARSSSRQTRKVVVVNAFSYAGCRVNAEPYNDEPNYKTALNHRSVDAAIPHGPV